MARRRTAVLLIGLGLLLLLALLGAVRWVRPVLEDFARAQAERSVGTLVASSMEEAVESGEIDYDSLVTLEKDREGRITAMQSNMAAFSRLQAAMTEKVLARLGEMEETELEVPVGTLSGIPILSGHGPKLRLPVQTAGSAAARFDNSFSQAGINQTRHQILLTMEVSVRIVLPLCRTSAAVRHQMAVGETVIVGSVPQALGTEYILE